MSAPNYLFRQRNDKGILNFEGSSIPKLHTKAFLARKKRTLKFLNPLPYFNLIPCKLDLFLQNHYQAHTLN